MSWETCRALCWRMVANPAKAQVAEGDQLPQLPSHVSPQLPRAPDLVHGCGGGNLQPTLSTATPAAREAEGGDDVRAAAV